MFPLQAALGKWCFFPQSVTPKRGSWHFLLQGRDVWKEESPVNASPAPSLWDWARVGRCQQDTKPVVLQNWPVDSWLLAPWPAFVPCMMAATTRHFVPPPLMSDGCRQNSAPVAFLLFDQIGRLRAMRAFQKYILSLPFDGCERNKNISKAHREDKIPCKQKCKRGGIQNHWGQRQLSQEICETSPSATRLEGRERQKLENVQKEAGFLFS